MAKRLKVLVVDDEPPAREELSFLLKKQPLVKGVKEASNGDIAIKMVENEMFDAVFLDIQMPGLSGIEAAQNILKINPTIKIIFVTAYDQYAITAYEIEALDYILKPFDEQRIKKTLNRLLKNILSVSNFGDKIDHLIKYIQEKHSCTEIKKIPCEKDGKIKLIEPKDVIYCTANEGQIFVVTEEGKMVSPFTLSELEDKFNFFRAHRSYLVNLDRVKELEYWFHGCLKLVLDEPSKVEIPVSRGKAKKLKEILGI
mgnify:CR=1 FL=1